MKDFAAGLVVAVIPWALYWRVLALWWMYDDAFLLRYAATHSPRAYLSMPSVWQEIPNRLFTPLLPLLYDWDLALFRFDPAAHYAHHLFDLSLCGLLLYATLRLCHGPLASALASLAFFLGKPTVEWASHLMVRHYVYALSACLVTIIAFVVYERRGRRAVLAISVAAFCVALAAKEFSIALPLVLLGLSARTMRQSLASIRWHIAAAALYIVWRTYMLGTPVGGYGWTMTGAELARMAVLLPVKMLAAVLTPWLPFGIAMAAVLLALCVRLVQAWRFLALFILAVAPFTPVGKQLELRYSVLAWLVIVIAALAGASRWFAAGYQRLTAAIVLCGLISLVALHRVQWRETLRLAMRMTEEAQTFVRLRPGEFLRNPLVPPAAMGETDWIKQNVLRGPAGSLWIYDDFYFCSQPPPRRVVEYQRGRMVDVTRLASNHGRAYCTSLREAPLRAAFHHEDETLSWTLGPYEDGRYRFVIANGIQAFDVPREGGFQLPGVHGLAFRVRYESPQGWITYSPELVLDFTRRPDFTWSR